MALRLHKSMAGTGKWILRVRSFEGTKQGNRKNARCWSRLEMTETSVVVTVENEFVLNGLASTEQVACCSNKHTQWPVLASQHSVTETIRASQECPILSWSRKKNAKLPWIVLGSTRKHGRN